MERDLGRVADALGTWATFRARFALVPAADGEARRGRKQGKHRKRSLATHALLMGIAFGLAGCGTQTLTQGEPNFNSAILLAGYVPPDADHPSVGARDGARLRLQPTALPDSCKEDANGNPLNTGNSTKQEAITNCVLDVKSYIDDQFREYSITLHHFADQGNAVADITVLGLTTAATGPVSLIAKTVLSGFGTVIGGAKSILNQDLLYKQTIEIVLNQMEADRYQQYTLMLQQMAGPNYTLPQAKNDLLAYFAAGTWDHAVTSLQTKVAANQANCKVETDATKVAASKGQTSTDTKSPSPSTNCPPAAPGSQQGTSLTPAAASPGQKFAASSGTGVYRVVKAAANESDNITVAYAANGTTFKQLAPMPFSQFARSVKPTPLGP